jgi:hypothetical protein
MKKIERRILSHEDVDDICEFTDKLRPGFVTLVLGDDLEIDMKHADMVDLINTAGPLGIFDRTAAICGCCEEPSDTLFNGYCPKCAGCVDFDFAIELRTKAVRAKAEVQS